MARGNKKIIYCQCCKKQKWGFEKIHQNDEGNSEKF
jgi:hypothetical protein